MLRAELRLHDLDASDLTAGPGEAFGQACRHEVARGGDDNRDRPSLSPDADRRSRIVGDEDVGAQGDQLLGDPGNALAVLSKGTILNEDSLPMLPAELPYSVPERPLARWRCRQLDRNQADPVDLLRRWLGLDSERRGENA